MCIRDRVSTQSTWGPPLAEFLSNEISDSRWQNLIKLNLISTYITDKGAIEIIHAIRKSKCCKISELNLKFNDLSFKSLNAIIEYFKTQGDSTCLKKVDFTKNIHGKEIEVGQKALNQLKTFLKGCKWNCPQINICLLYTSPSPRDLSTSRMPSSA
eukprot:TRINITY_DN59928_c0_g1_i1.p1 TRINITY_DN59928_c0_g1~~TRINITY_DN59928_c0_g1_i1.p1  ORF type:complete len:156 (+),score=30.68 TRINITY_DN59928_c0_g1_i1:153-620(+)